MRRTLPLVPFLLFPVLAQAQLLPWRRMQEQKHQDYERRLQALEQAQRYAPQQPQVIVIGGPRQDIPLQQIPLGGPPRQDIPLGGAPLQQMPFAQPPQQSIPLGGNGPPPQVISPGEAKPRPGPTSGTMRGATSYQRFMQGLARQ